MAWTTLPLSYLDMQSHVVKGEHPAAKSNLVSRFCLPRGWFPRIPTRWASDRQGLRIDGHFLGRRRSLVCV